MSTALDLARTVADAVLYEGYLLYPYRASSSKNRVRWQFGVLGPPSARPEISEPATMSAQCLLTAESRTTVRLYLRFLQLQARSAQSPDGNGFSTVPELRAGAESWTSWDEAVPQEIPLGPFRLAELIAGRELDVTAPAGMDVEALPVGRLLRRREQLSARLSLRARPVGGALCRLEIEVANTTATNFDATASRDSANVAALLGSHLLVEAEGGRFVSLLEPPPQAGQAAADCAQRRCWPVLASATDDIVLISPIILYDHPELAAESKGAFFDATEIDEILTLRVMTMTAQEKREARATDPKAAAIIDRCDSMSAEDLQQLHGILRDPGGADRPAAIGTDPFQVPAMLTMTGTGGAPWWDPGVDGSVDPEKDSLVIDGILVAKGSRVRVRPQRRADAQDMFFTGQCATVTAIFADVDGNDHVAVVLSDDPAADLHEWYGRFLYFAPDEVQPLIEDTGDQNRGEV